MALCCAVGNWQTQLLFATKGVPVKDGLKAPGSNPGHNALRLHRIVALFFTRNEETTVQFGLEALSRAKKMSSQHRRTKTSNYFPRPELSRKQEQLKSKRRRMSQGQMFDGLTTPELQEWVQLTGIMVEWCRNVRQPRRHWEDEERAALGEIARRENVDEPPVED